MAPSNILLESGTNELEIVEFYLDGVNPEGEKYRWYFGVNVSKVLEIIRLPKITALPSTPHPCVVGTFNLRSKVIPLIDLAIWLNIKVESDGKPIVIVSEFNRIVNAFLVSGVTRIHRLSWENVEPPSSYVADFSEHSFTGVVKFPDHILLLLDMERIIWDINPNLAMQNEPDKEATVEKSDSHVYKALVVDDSTSIRKMIVNTLERDGYQVFSDVNGKEAWDRLVQIKEQSVAANAPISDYLHIVVTDIEMPAMDGHNLCRRIKDDPVLKELPVILFSSLINDALFHKGQSVGADDQVTKPEISTLTQRAKTLIEAKFPR
ncbi:MAG: chemotaxis protein CheV [Desulfovibrionaceae bacterium]|nr:chemotaxis protein CheV [Desulfovibrionaceae bacterium]MBF0513365.1 chemotaxis protein CheV [Desulfovibrionaceae bacterium]